MSTLARRFDWHGKIQIKQVGAGNAGSDAHTRIGPCASRHNGCLRFCYASPTNFHRRIEIESRKRKRSEVPSLGWPGCDRVTDVLLHKCPHVRVTEIP